MSAAPMIAAALELVGTPFRLHGRDPATGLDCIGLAGAALERAGYPVALPIGYRLRGDGAAMLARWNSPALQRLAPGDPPAPGQIMFCEVGPAQPHLLILVPGGFVQAHAGLRRVVFTPGENPWPVIARWQLAEPSAAAPPTPTKSQG